MPIGIERAIGNKTVTPTAFEDKNDILSDASLQGEVGYTKMEDGNFLVSMTCPMPNIDPCMIAWWFWWHPQADERYRVWFPHEHYGVSYAKKDRAYFNQKTLPAFQANTQFPTERIGKIVMPLRIDFVSAPSFGFSEEKMKDNNIPLIVCGHVSALRGLVRHTEMAHIFKQTEDGLLLISRFWIGKTLRNPLLRKLILTDRTAEGMAAHCCIEYRNLAEILPILYEKAEGGKINWSL